MACEIHFQSFFKMAPDPRWVKSTNLVQLLDSTAKSQKAQLSAPGGRANYMSPSKAGQGLWEEKRTPHEPTGLFHF
jgi:hypothetical protein